MARDKWLHLIAGFLISLAVYFATGSVLYGYLAGTLAGVVKDVVWDLILKRGRFEVGDIICTSFGAWLVFVIFEWKGN